MTVLWLNVKMPAKALSPLLKKNVLKHTNNEALLAEE